MCMYKMVDIEKEKYKNSNIEAIVDGIDMLWLNENHTEKLVNKIVAAVTSKYDQNIKSTDMN